MIDLTSLRARFPLLEERLYCATPGLGPVLRETYEDLEAYRRTFARRSRALEEWVERYEALHGLVERLLEAPPGSVFLTDTATSAQAALAAAVTPRGARTRIVTGAADFKSSRYLWSAQERRGFDVIALDAHGDAAPLLEAIDERVAIVALSLVSPRTGALLPAEAIAARCREAGATLVLDAYQAVGVVPVDVGALGADVVVGGTHKWLHGGGTGLAFGYVAPALSARLEPVYPGWLGHASLHAFADRFEPRAGARRLAQGTPAMEPVYTARAGLELALEVGVAALRARSLALTARLHEGLSARGIAVRTPAAPERRGGMVCVDLVDGGEAVVAALAAEGIDVDTRAGAGVRVGPHPTQTEDDMDRVVDALARAVSS
ncbi:MAG: aminotransferase class V-fold PLP-dependent enzyme [Myxococcota bacterium]|nr:aminotransferase class V-fold PLP-dependent enzyme [Myxococcota bacterium]